MKATRLLEDQHRNVEALFDRLRRGRIGHEAVLQTLADHLVAHMAIEQDIFYPAIRAIAEIPEETIAENYEEHALTELALKRLCVARDEDSFRARLVALEELVSLHVNEEEEELFPLVEDAFSEAMLEQLGSTMKERFEEVRAQGFAAAVPKGLTRTSADLALRANRAHAKKSQSPAAA
jgi:hemerythrin-like domain-containing protein